MHLRPLLRAAALSGGLLLAPVHAGTTAAGDEPAPADPVAPAAAAAPAADPAAAPEGSAVETELAALVERVRAKLQAGAGTEEAFADELKAFDDLMARQAGVRTNDVAMVGVMKALLYVEVFDQPEVALPMLRSIVADYPGTEVAGQLPELIAGLEKAGLTAVGREFPPFKATATDGTEVDLAAYRGRVVLVDFWATWCGPCVQEMPHVIAAYRAYHDRGFEVIGISLDTEAGELASFTAENKMPWPQIFDGRGWKSELAQARGISSIPATFLLDREGRIVARNLRGDALSARLAELLAPTPPQ